MTIPATGSVSLQDIEDEFGGTGEVSLSEYYRGNSYESAVSGNNTSVSQSGSIKLSQFRGSELKRYIEYKVLGGGGGGGAGYDDGGAPAGAYPAGDGGSSTLSSPTLGTVTAVGGEGGDTAIYSHGTNISSIKGGDATIAAGYSQDFGTSGAADLYQTAGAGSGFVAGGTGGGGDYPQRYDASGSAGQGGSAGSEVTDAAYFSLGEVLTYSVGGGGAKRTGYHNGADGLGGYIVLIKNGTQVVASGSNSTYTVV